MPTKKKERVMLHPVIGQYSTIEPALEKCLQAEHKILMLSVRLAKALCEVSCHPEHRELLDEWSTQIMTLLRCSK